MFIILILSIIFVDVLANNSVDVNTFCNKDTWLDECNELLSLNQIRQRTIPIDFCSDIDPLYYNVNPLMKGLTYYGKKNKCKGHNFLRTENYFCNCYQEKFHCLILKTPTSFNIKKETSFCEPGSYVYKYYLEDNFNRFIKRDICHRENTTCHPNIFTRHICNDMGNFLVFEQILWPTVYIPCDDLNKRMNG